MRKNDMPDIVELHPNLILNCVKDILVGSDMLPLLDGRGNVVKITQIDRIIFKELWLTVQSARGYELSVCRLEDIADALYVGEEDFDKKMYRAERRVWDLREKIKCVHGGENIILNSRSVRGYYLLDPKKCTIW